jgi:F420-0:gamma-glutamyl ligase
MVVGMSADQTSFQSDVGTLLIRVKTRPLVPTRDDLYDALDPALPQLLDGDVLAITSKVVAIHRGRCVPVTSVQDKEELVEAEADAWHLDRKCWNRCEQLERPFCVLAKRSL